MELFLLTKLISLQSLSTTDNVHVYTHRENYLLCICLFYDLFSQRLAATLTKAISLYVCMCYT